MASNVAARRIYKLRQKCQKKESGFRIKDVHDNALREDAAQLGARRGVRNFDRFVLAQLLHAEIDQVGSAKVFHHAECNR